MQQLRTKHEIAFRQLCLASDLPYSTFMRWKQRAARHEPLLLPPGPRKLGEPDWDAVFADLEDLKHGAKRSRGAPALWQIKYRDVLSRRRFGCLVAQVRHGVMEGRRADLTRVQWHMPRLVWALDPAEIATDSHGHKVHVTTVRDLASQYAFAPIAGHTPCGEQVAGHLSRLFSQHGPPLFLKRDNGGNLNHPMINAVLRQYWVIPLNSPVRYPQYNGAVEHTQEEFQKACDERLRYRSACHPDHFEAYAEAAAAELNHKQRRALRNRTACEVFHAARSRAMVNRRRRKEVTDQIIVAAAAALECVEHVNSRTVQRAWRLAIEAWLAENRVITLSQSQRGVTHFSEENVSLSLM